MSREKSRDPQIYRTGVTTSAEMEANKHAASVLAHESTRGDQAIEHDRSMLEMVLDRQSASLDGLSHVIDALEDKLRVILRDGGPEPSNKGHADDHSPSISPLCMHIDKTTSRIQGLSSRIANLHSRLDT